jgi:tRNA threonylcarbamoyl adenosine modification protein YeaZ
VLVIAFDTATPAVTVALHDGRAVVARETAIDARRHGELLAPAIQAVLTSAGARNGDLTAVAVGVGPGPYTGLRAGLVTAQVFGSTLGVAVYGVCTLDIIAAKARHAAAGREFAVATDARRREVYWARYAADGERLSPPMVSLPAELAGRLTTGELPAGSPVAGQGPRLYAELAAAFDVIEPAYPDAADLACIAADRIARGLPADPPEPLYLRRPDAREPGRPKRVTPA